MTSFDTAVIYGTEDGLGSGLSGLSCPRSSLYVTTKTPDWAWTKEEIVEEVEKSLKRLQVTYLDLVLLHTPAPRKGAAFLKKALTDEQIDRLPDPMDAKGEDMKNLIRSYLCYSAYSHGSQKTVRLARAGRMRGEGAG